MALTDEELSGFNVQAKPVAVDIPKLDRVQPNSGLSQEELDGFGEAEDTDSIARENLNLNYGQDADKAAERQLKARELGLPRSTSINDEALDKALKQKQKADFDKRLSEGGMGIATTKYFQKSENAAISHDDWDILNSIETTLRDEWKDLKKDVPDFSALAEGGVKRAAAGVLGFDAQALGTVRMVSDLPNLWINTLVDLYGLGETGAGKAVKENNPFALASSFAKELRANVKLYQKEITPESDSFTADVVGSGVTSAVQSSIPSVASIAARNPYALAVTSALVAGDSYSEGIDKGMNMPEALTYAGGMAGINQITESRVFKGMKDIYDKAKGMNKGAGAKELKESFLKTFKADMLGEQAATFLEDALDTAMNPDYKDKTWEEFLYERPMAAAKTFFSTAVSMPIQGGLTAGAGYLRRTTDEKTAKKLEKQVTKIINSENDQASIDKIISFGQPSLTAKRDPDEFEAFIKSIDESGEMMLYVPADIAQTMADLPEYLATQLDGRGGDVEIPLNKFMRDIVTNPEMLAVMRPHLTKSPDGLSMDALKKEGDNGIRAVIDEAKRAIQENNEINQGFEDVKQQLLDAYQIQDDEAGALADAYMQHVKIVSKDTGMTIPETIKYFNARFAKPDEILSDADQEYAEADIEKRRKEALDDADYQEQSIEKTITSGIKLGLDREEISKMLSANSNALNLGGDNLAINNYIQDRIDGKETRPFSEFRGNSQELINAKYDEELAAIRKKGSPDGKIITIAQESGYEGEDIGESKEWVAATKKFGKEGMTKEARMARAKEAGFDVDNVYYHGTKADVKAFDREMSEIGAVFFSKNPDFSSEEMFSGKGGNIIPAYLKTENTFDFENPEHIDTVLGLISEDDIENEFGDEDLDSIKDRLKEGLWEDIELVIIQEAIQNAGFDSFYVNDGGEKNIGVLSENQIRSINAAFDPDYKDSANILSQGDIPQGRIDVYRYLTGFNGRTKADLIKVAVDNIHNHEKLYTPDGEGFSAGIKKGIKNVKDAVLVFAPESKKFAMVWDKKGDLFLVTDSKPKMINNTDEVDNGLTESDGKTLNILSDVFYDIENSSPEMQEKNRIKAIEGKEIRRRQERLQNIPSLSHDFDTALQELADWAENKEEFEAALAPNMMDLSDRNLTRLGRATLALSPDEFETAGRGDVTIYRAMPKGESIEAGDWVSMDEAYARGHESNVDDGDAETVGIEVKGTDVWWYGADEKEWVYIPEDTWGDITSIDELWNKLTDGKKPDNYPEAEGKTLYQPDISKIPEITRKIIGKNDLLLAYTLLTQDDEVFSLPVTNHTSVPEILRAQMPNVGKITLDSDAAARSKDATTAWSVLITVGKEKRTVEAKVYQNKDAVWIDVAKLESGNDGKRIYNAIANYAFNTKKVFQGDPDGLSDEAKSRRLENMISSALKFGTTDHLWPHEKQMEEGAGVPPIKWKDGDDAHNLEQMIRASYEFVKKQFPEISNLIYDANTDQFIDSKNGEVWNEERFDKLAGKYDESSTGVSGQLPKRKRDRDGNRVTAGSTTLERAVFTHTFLRPESSKEERRRILAKIGEFGSKRITFFQSQPTNITTPEQLADKLNPSKERETSLLQKKLNQIEALSNCLKKG